ncbi:MAG: DUF885 family protein [Caulobacteraceae bacterium]|nr:DUF885 family protein [Caulobacter sp.]
MRRRDLLSLAASTSAAALAPAALAQVRKAPGPVDRAAERGPQADAGPLAPLWDAFLQEDLVISPEFATSLGLDKGRNAQLKSRLGDRSDAGRAAHRRLTDSQIARLRAAGRPAAGTLGAVDYDTVLYNLESDRGLLQFDFGTRGMSGEAEPYVISQLTGAYQGVPDFLDSQHRIDTAVDADAYLSRLEAFAVGLDADTQSFREDTGAGVIPPDFIMDTTLVQLKNARTTPENADVVTALARKAREKGLSPDYARKAQAIYAARIGPALDRQLAAVSAARPRATSAAGVGRLAQGAALYAAGLHASTTTQMKPEDIHALGLAQGKEVSARLDETLKANGLTRGTVAERVQGLYKDPAQLFPNTAAGKAQLLAYLNNRLTGVKAKLPQWFGHLPHYAVEVRPVPAAIDAGAPLAYTNFPAVDGSRPGIIYFNLHDLSEWPKFNLPSTLYHEGLPGHQLQGGVALENTSIPLLRRSLGFSGYQEGWALYAEQLADEMGMYADDPLGRVGYLKAQLFRCGRLVVDTGIHHYGWSRDKAVDYLMALDGDARGSTTREVDRYCVWPGQACAYKIGHTVINRIRDRSRAALGSRFDIRSFHDAMLRPGAMPLDVLDGVMARWTASGGAAG